MKPAAVTPVADAPVQSGDAHIAPALVDLDAVGLSYGVRSVLDGITSSLALVESLVLLAEPADREAQAVLVAAGFAPDADHLTWSSARHHAPSLDAFLATLRGRGIQLRDVRRDRRHRCTALAAALRVVRRTQL